MRLKAFCARHATGLSFFFALLFDFILHCTDGFSGWAATWYALDYSLGSGSRLLVGSVLKLLTGGAVTTAAAVTFAYASTLLLIALTALLIDRLYLAAPGEAKLGALGLIALYAAAPFSIRFLWNAANFGRLDLYLYILTVLALLLALDVKKPAVRALIVALLSLIALLVHQIFALIFFPVLFALLCTDAFNGERVTLRRVLPGLIASVAVVIGFFAVQFFSKLNTAEAGELTTLLAARTDLDVSFAALDFEYCHDFLYGFTNHTLPFLAGGKPVVLLLLELLLLSPAIALCAFLWKAMFSDLRARGVRVWRAPQMYILLSLLCYLPPFLLTVDWSRWLAALFGGQALTLLMLLAEKDAAAEKAFYIFSGRMRARPAPYALMLIYMALLSSLRAREFLPECDKLFSLLTGLIH